MSPRKCFAVWHSEASLSLESWGRLLAGAKVV